jgi:hypothetical protein
VECAHPPASIQDSSCARLQPHGQLPVNSVNRRTVRSRDPMIDSPNRRDRCWRAHPASIASNSASSGRSGVAPVTNDSADDPATRIPSPTQPPLAARHQMPPRGTRCNAIR